VRTALLVLLLLWCSTLAADEAAPVDPIVPVPLSKLSKLLADNRAMQVRLGEYSELMGRAATVMQDLLDKLKLSQSKECST